jgi:hypothetical protein
MVPPRSELGCASGCCRRDLPLLDERDHRVRAAGLELGAVGAGQAGHVARVLDGGHLHAQADAEVGNAVLARVLRGDDLALDAALAEAAGHQDGVEARQLRGRLGRQRLGVDVLDLHLGVVVDAGVAQRLVEALVGVGQVGVLAAHRDRHRLRRVAHLVHQGVPALQVGRAGEQLQLHADELVQALLVQQARHLVDGVDVRHGDHAVQRHVGEQADLLALVVGDGRSARHSSTSGCMPISRSFCTVCCVGLVLSSPAAAMKGT